MPLSTLQRLHDALPSVKLQQTYGLTETGILRSQSRDSNSLWIKVGGEGYETKIVDGRLWIRAQSAMLGYLNASPFDAEGYLDTGDLVKPVASGCIGRAQPVINVGGNRSIRRGRRRDPANGQRDRRRRARRPSRSSGKLSRRQCCSRRTSYCRRSRRLRDSIAASSRRTKCGPNSAC